MYLYEDFVESYEETIRKILAFLGLSTDVEIEPPRLSKLADSLTEEWIERFRWPRYGREPVTRGPAVDLAHIFHDKGMAKLLA